MIAAFDKWAGKATALAGHPAAFFGAVAVIVVWALLGPFFDFGEGWQLTINTGTTCVTFIMLFLVQRSQNKDSLALHIKLDELLRAHKEASNTVVAAETLSEDDLKKHAEEYRAVADAARRKK